MKALLVLCVLVLAACNLGPPSRAADATGYVTTATETATRILVEANPGQQIGDKATVTIDTSTRIWSIKGTSATKTDAKSLAIGSKVRVWFDGPVATSYPVQGKAADIAIDAP